MVEFENSHISIILKNNFLAVTLELTDEIIINGKKQKKVKHLEKVI